MSFAVEFIFTASLVVTSKMKLIVFFNFHFLILFIIVCAIRGCGCNCATTVYGGQRTTFWGWFYSGIQGLLPQVL